MPITIDDPDLEDRIASLGKRQLVPVSKTAMATAILREAVSDDRGKPVEKWREKARRLKPPDAA